MQQVSGFEAAAPAAMRMMGQVRRLRRERVEAASDLAAAPSEQLARPRSEGLVHAHVCAQSGRLPGPSCHHVHQEVFAPGHVPTELCEAHDPDGTWVLGPRYRAWLERNPRIGMRLGTGAAPLALRVTYPEDGASLLLPLHGHAPAIPLRASRDLAVRFEVDGSPWPADRLYPLVPGRHRVVAIAVAEGNGQTQRSPPSTFTVVRQ